MGYSHEKINQLEGGWYVVFSDGSVITENDMIWVQVPNKKDIQIMGLKWRNKCFELKDKDSYIPPGETHMRELSGAGDGKIQVTKQTLVGRFIGYYDEDCKVLSRIDTSSGEFTTERSTSNP